MLRLHLFLLFIVYSCKSAAQMSRLVKTVDVDSGWANNSVNTVVFRKNSLVTFGNTQYIAFYNQQQFVVIGKRKIGESKWQLQQTAYKGRAADAHNSISIMVDGDGYLHMAWDHHGNRLNYCKSKEPGSLELTEKLSMTGSNESNVSYPEFHKLPGGNLIFLYRDGQSGRGNLVINSYDRKAAQWTQLHANLVDGEGKRNAYWQAFIDTKGVMHLSWVWRETPDVASNHDMCYAQSPDGGKTWSTSAGTKYQLPITAATAEYAATIPQKTELINQTSMFADEAGNPYIATYWRENNSTVPQYHLIYRKGNKWMSSDLQFRKTAFSLSGAGTRRIPISRPQVIAWHAAGKLNVALIFRDEERGNKVSAAICDNMEKTNWKVVDLSEQNVGSWEPSYDTELWKEKKLLHLFVQRTEQLDAEGKANIPAQMIKVLEWDPVSEKTKNAGTKKEVLEIIQQVNAYWQTQHPKPGRAFWDEAAYHTGNMEAYFITRNESFKEYSEQWAEHNQWMGARSNNKEQWKYNYGETDDHVLFGDWQICFQTYIDLYNIDKDERKIKRAIEVMEYEMSTAKIDYWWWADGLYMVMPVMTKLYKVTNNKQYLSKLFEYFSYANSIMYDRETGLYYRDAKYVYPKHKSANGKKDFWARGNGWVFAGLAKVLADLPRSDEHRKEYINKYKGMAKALKASQQPGGHWTRSLLDSSHAPGPETSGTAFFTYGFLWGINNGYLEKKEYLPVIKKAWNYLLNVALQPDGSIGYIQPIGERAIPGQVVNRHSSSNFGTGTFLLACCEMYRFLNTKK